MNIISTLKCQTRKVQWLSSPSRLLSWTAHAPGPAVEIRFYLRRYSREPGAHFAPCVRLI